MFVRAKISFSGVANMFKGQTKDITSQSTVDDLINAGYVEMISEVEKEDLKPMRKKVIKNEAK